MDYLDEGANTARVRKAEDDKILNTTLNINGRKVRLGDLHADPYAAKEFHNKVKLLMNDGTDEPDNMEPPTVGTGEDDMEPLEDKLFKGKGAK